MIDSLFEPSRQAALDRLMQFIPKAGDLYTSRRNTDAGPNQPSTVSTLSPYIRHRLITEYEIVDNVLAHHGPIAAEKFIEEVIWRTYWKGWLEMRPQIWQRFLAERTRQHDSFLDTSVLMSAEKGETGIEGFDDWAREIVETGYLHNHARMWFASIWIFTLHLPWALGADFFLRHLIDADSASNTLSWRWVAGLQTAGKTYLATTENIARYTNGRFAPAGLAQKAIALYEPEVQAAQALPDPAYYDVNQPSLLLVTSEDMHPESLFLDKSAFDAVLVVADPRLQWGDKARHFVKAAANDTVLRNESYFNCAAHLTERLEANVLIAAAQSAGVRQIITPYAPIGPVADALNLLTHELAAQGVTLAQVRRDWDTRFWPYATKGFFSFKKNIFSLFKESGLKLDHTHY
jgi:deoxyribodipyrimidine photo-lyase